MNEIIRKAVEALKAEKPDLSYIRGMLETVLAMSPQTAVYKHESGGAVVLPTTPLVPAAMDEGNVLDSIAKAGLANIQPAVQE